MNLWAVFMAKMRHSINFQWHIIIDIFWCHYCDCLLLDLNWFLFSTRTRVQRCRYIWHSLLCRLLCHFDRLPKVFLIFEVACIKYGHWIETTKQWTMRPLETRDGKIRCGGYELLSYDIDIESLFSSILIVCCCAGEKKPVSISKCDDSLLLIASVEYVTVLESQYSVRTNFGWQNNTKKTKHTVEQTKSISVWQTNGVIKGVWNESKVIGQFLFFFALIWNHGSLALDCQ